MSNRRSIISTPRRQSSEAIAPGDYSLAIPTDSRRRLAQSWLLLGVGALLGSGLFSLLLVVARAPYTQTLFPWSDFFHTALVVHVDLSVLVWFVAFGGMLWSVNSTRRWISLGWCAFALALIGTLAMVTAPFSGASNPLMSNYIPILQQRWFLAGLLLFALGTLFAVARAMIAIPPVGQYANGAGALRFGLNTAAVATALALMAFAWSYAKLGDTPDARAYFELLFWGGGHVLQFTYTLLMLVAWLWLTSASGLRLPITPRVTLLLFALGLLTVFTVPLIYYAHDIASVQHITFFTWLMRYGGSLATLPLALAVTWAVARGGAASHAQRAYRAALLSSMLLFGVGGGIGFLISGSNVTIPAHYHGSIVGVTLAFMGLTYYLLPKFGYGEPNARWVVAQPWLYGSGQLLHVAGLVISGGYGVQRKVAGAAQGLEGIGKVAGMGLMGFGGLIAIIGGVVFLLIVFGAMRRTPAHTTLTPATTDR